MQLTYKYDVIYKKLNAAINEAMDELKDTDPEFTKGFAVFDLAFSQLFQDWTDYDISERIFGNEELYASKGENIDAIVEELYN